MIQMQSRLNITGWIRCYISNCQARAGKEKSTLKNWIWRIMRRKVLECSEENTQPRNCLLTCTSTFTVKCSSSVGIIITSFPNRSTITPARFSLPAALRSVLFLRTFQNFSSHNPPYPVWKRCDDDSNRR